MLHFTANISCSISACEQFPECSLCFQGVGVGEWKDGRIWLALQPHQSERCLSQDGQGLWTRLKPGSVTMSSCCRELMFPMTGTQSYVPTTFFFALKPAAVFIAQGGWAYLENITSSSEGCLCCPDKVHTTYQDYHVNINAPTFLWWDEEARSVGLLLLSTLLNSPTRCCHHHYYSSTHESFIQAVILSWGTAWL